MYNQHGSGYASNVYGQVPISGAAVFNTRPQHFAGVSQHSAFPYQSSGYSMMSQNHGNNPQWYQQASGSAVSSGVSGQAIRYYDTSGQYQLSTTQNSASSSNQVPQYETSKENREQYSQHPSAKIDRHEVHTSSAGSRSQHQPSESRPSRNSYQHIDAKASAANKKYYCSMCNIRFVELHHFDVHINGLLHERNRVKLSQFSDVTEDELKKCKACSGETVSDWPYHVQGRAHCEAVLRNYYRHGIEKFERDFLPPHCDFSPKIDDQCSDAEKQDLDVLMLMRSGLLNRFVCKLCVNKQLTKLNWVDHISGKKHKQNCYSLINRLGKDTFFEAYGDVPMPETFRGDSTDYIMPHSETSNSPTQEIEENQRHHCKVCDWQAVGDSLWRDHIASSLHCNRLLCRYFSLGASKFEARYGDPEFSRDIDGKFREEEFNDLHSRMMIRSAFLSDFRCKVCATNLDNKNKWLQHMYTPRHNKGVLQGIRDLGRDYYDLHYGHVPRLCGHPLHKLMTMLIQEPKDDRTKENMCKLICSVFQKLGDDNELQALGLPEGCEEPEATTTVANPDPKQPPPRQVFGFGRSSSQGFTSGQIAQATGTAYNHTPTSLGGATIMGTGILSPAMMMNSPQNPVSTQLTQEAAQRSQARIPASISVPPSSNPAFLRSQLEKQLLGRSSGGDEVYDYSHTATGQTSQDNVNRFVYEKPGSDNVTSESLELKRGTGASWKDTQRNLRVQSGVEEAPVWKPEPSQTGPEQGVWRPQMVQPGVVGYPTIIPPNVIWAMSNAGQEPGHGLAHDYYATPPSGNAAIVRHSEQPPTELSRGTEQIPNAQNRGDLEKNRAEDNRNVQGQGRSDKDRRADSGSKRKSSPQAGHKRRSRSRSRDAAQKRPRSPPQRERRQEKHVDQRSRDKQSRPERSPLRSREGGSRSVRDRSPRRIDRSPRRTDRSARSKDRAPHGNRRSTRSGDRTLHGNRRSPHGNNRSNRGDGRPTDAYERGSIRDRSPIASRSNNRSPPSNERGIRGRSPINRDHGSDYKREHLPHRRDSSIHRTSDRLSKSGQHGNSKHMEPRSHRRSSAEPTAKPHPLSSPVRSTHRSGEPESAHRSSNQHNNSGPHPVASNRRPRSPERHHGQEYEGNHARMRSPEVKRHRAEIREHSMEPHDYRGEQCYAKQDDLVHREQLYDDDQREIAYRSPRYTVSPKPSDTAVYFESEDDLGRLEADPLYIERQPDLRDILRMRKNHQQRPQSAGGEENLVVQVGTDSDYRQVALPRGGKDEDLRVTLSDWTQAASVPLEESGYTENQDYDMRRSEPTVYDRVGAESWNDCRQEVEDVSRHRAGSERQYRSEDREDYEAEKNSGHYEQEGDNRHGFAGHKHHYEAGDNKRRYDDSASYERVDNKRRYEESEGYERPHNKPNYEDSLRDEYDRTEDKRRYEHENYDTYDQRSGRRNEHDDYEASRHLGSERWQGKREDIDQREAQHNLASSTSTSEQHDSQTGRARRRRREADAVSGSADFGEAGHRASRGLLDREAKACYIPKQELRTTQQQHRKPETRVDDEVDQFCRTLQQFIIMLYNPKSRRGQSGSGDALAGLSAKEEQMARHVVEMTGVRDMALAAQAVRVLSGLDPAIVTVLSQLEPQVVEQLVHGDYRALRNMPAFSEMLQTLGRDRRNVERFNDTLTRHGFVYDEEWRA